MDTNVQLTILALVAVGALALIVQTIFLIVLATVARKAVRSLREELEEYRSSIMPIVTKTRDLIERLGPRIEDAAEELSEVTRSLRMQTADIQKTADDILARAQRQASRVDGMLTTVFDGAERAGSFMAEAVHKPMRQISGVIASVKAVVETLLAPEAPASTHTTVRYPDGTSLR